MNIRVILIVAVILIFAIGSGILTYNNAQGLNLQEAYNSGKVQITQETAAGTIPHQVKIKNKDKNPLEVEEGYVLTSNSSQDLVIARNEIIPPNSSSSISAYCLEPNQRAKENSELAVAGQAPYLIQNIISSSNLQNPSEAFNTQLRIWVVANGPDFNIYSGEVVAVVEKQGISYSDLKENISTVKIEVMTKFNLTETQMNNISINSSLANQGQISGLESILNGISEFIGTNA